MEVEWRSTTDRKPERLTGVRPAFAREFSDMTEMHGKKIRIAVIYKDCVFRCYDTSLVIYYES